MLHLIQQVPEKPITEQQSQWTPTSTAGKVHTIEEAPISPYKTFTNRVRHKKGTFKQITLENDLVESDPAIENYKNKIKASRGNNGYYSPKSRSQLRSGTRQFLNFTGIPLSNHAYSDLVKWKRENPNSTEIEQALTLFSQIPPLRSNATLSSQIQGIFRANFAPLQVRINTHFPPAEENCSEGTFLEIYHHLDQESKDMIQWQQYAPERATAIYEVPFEDINLSRQDYAVIWIQAQRTKMRVKHPCFIPIEFATRIIQTAKASNRECPFPNHESQWKRITKFAKDEYKVKLTSHYIRKRYNDIASATNIPKSKAAFFLGDKTKIEKEGLHLDLIYGRGLRFTEELINGSEKTGTGFHTSGLADALNIETPKIPNTHTQSQQEIIDKQQQIILRLTNEIQTLTKKLDTLLNDNLSNSLPNTRTEEGK